MAEKRIAKYAWVYKDLKFKQVCGVRKFKDSTKRNMAVALNCYCTYLKSEFDIEMTPAMLYSEADHEQNTMIDGRIKSEPDRRVSDYLAGYPDYLNGIEPPLSEKVKAERLRNIRQFYRVLKISLPDIKITRPDAKECNQYIPTLKDLQTTIAATYSARNKAIVLTQASSGMGTGEVLALKKEDFWKGYDPDTGVTIFHPTRKKVGTRYRTFITPEASDAIKKWLLIADTDDERLFELEEFGLIDMYQRLNKKAGFELPKSNVPTQKGPYKKIRSHAMRKYFHNTLMNRGAPINLIHYLCGRQETEVDKAYSHWETDVLKTEYMKYMGYLSISPLLVKVIESAEYTAIKAELEAERAKNVMLEARLAGLEDKVNEFFVHQIDGEEVLERNPDAPISDPEVLAQMPKSKTGPIQIAAAIKKSRSMATED